MTDYCSYYFGKSLNDLTYSDVQAFFQQEKEESINLEFKSGQDNTKSFDDILNKKIIRAIASFLNSEGGILIWGSPRESEVTKGDKKVKIAQGDLQPNKVYNEKDQLVNKIIRSISYMPVGVNVIVLEENDQYVYIFEVQESQNKPHQYNDQYPIRIDGQSLPAPHYLVESMFNQVKFPTIEGYLKPLYFIEKDGDLILHFDFKLFNFSPSIPGKDIQLYINTTGGIFEENNDSFVQPNPTKLLCFGLNPSLKLTLAINVWHLRNPNFQCNITIFISGENLPTKFSEYRVDFRKLNQSFRAALIPINENLDLHKTKDLLANDRESLIARFLEDDDF